MAAFKKFFKDLKNEHVLGIVGLVFLVFALYQYSNNKNIFQLGMTSMTDSPPAPAKGEILILHQLNLLVHLIKIHMLHIMAFHNLHLTLPQLLCYE